MTDFSLAELKLLVAHETGPCVSLYMPIDRATARPQQETDRVKHFLKQAETQLMALPMRRPEALAFLAPALALVESADFWRQPREGLALFIGLDFLRAYDDTSIAIAFSEALTVSDHFQIKPLLPLLTDNGQFYILVLRQNHVGLLQGTRDTIRAIQLEGAPTDIHEALGEQMAATETQGRPLDVGDHHQKFGAYDPTQKEDDRVLRYFRTVNEVVHNYLATSNAPLLLAGMEFQHAIYREANTYPHLSTQSITHNAEHLSNEELHRLGWAIVEPLFQQTRQHALDRFHQNNPNGHAATELSAILEAAYIGRIDTLFITEEDRRFGKFDQQTMQLTETEALEPGGVDLIDEAATKTLLDGGQVYVLSPEIAAGLPTIPAALLRY